MTLTYDFSGITEKSAVAFWLFIGIEYIIPIAREKRPPWYVYQFVYRFFDAGNYGFWFP